ncbi:hypothetical protein SAMN04489747_3048 [Auraticoccus monumenti]|uniref:Uncharacterized protein n=1 Tax=Auraticoccus monumenti TaxID=675864 RepID=A0A1G7BT56_9ACTN|nr:hypothetical protein SAMN04489747_3048 [Auraticoccus monumenti]
MPDTHVAPRGPRSRDPRASLLAPPVLPARVHTASDVGVAGRPDERPVLHQVDAALLWTLLLTAAALCVEGLLPW